MLSKRTLGDCALHSHTLKEPQMPAELLLCIVHFIHPGTAAGGYTYTAGRNMPYALLHVDESTFISWRTVYISREDVNRQVFMWPFLIISWDKFFISLVVYGLQPYFVSLVKRQMSFLSLFLLPFSLSPASTYTRVHSFSCQTQ